MPLALAVPVMTALGMLTGKSERAAATCLSRSLLYLTKQVEQGAGVCDCRGAFKGQGGSLNGSEKAQAMH